MSALRSEENNQDPQTFVLMQTVLTKLIRSIYSTAGKVDIGQAVVIDDNPAGPAGYSCRSCGDCGIAAECYHTTRGRAAAA
jgi:hypothetical protein